MLRALAVLLAVVGVGSALLPSALAQGGGPVLGGTVANQVYIQGLAITDLVLPAATGGTAPLTYNLVGARPAGLNFDLPTRTLSGIPTAAQAATTYTWRVTDANSVTDEETFTIQVDADVPPAFPASTTIANQSYIQGFAIANLVLPAATGGNTPLSYGIVGGLPQGLSVDPTTLTLSGAPTVAQAATTYTWRVTDLDGDTDDRTFTIEVAADVPPAFPASTTIANQSYIQGFAIANLVLPTATGGNGTLSYGIVGGLPQGLSVDPTTLTLSGAPTVAQAATTYTWRVTDLDGDTDDRTFTIEVDADVSPTFPAQPPIGDWVYIDGVAITDLVLPTATGGNGALTYALVGTPPAGLNFDLPTRTLSGAPTGTQTPTTYTWRVTDVDGDTAEETFTIEVEPDTNPTLATVGNQVYTEGRTITDLVLPAGAGGNAPLTYLLVGALPSGLAPPGSTRTISGTPTATHAEATYTWRVTDADGDVAEQTFTIEVVPPLEFVFPPEWFYYRKFPKDVAITPWVWPGATGGKGPLTFSLNPSPPLLPGLTVDTSTRTLSGTPTAITTIVDYTWTVTDAVGNQESTIIGIGIRAATGVPNPPTLTSVVPGSVPEQLVVTFSWSGPCALLGPRAGYTVEYRKSASSWRRAFDVTAGSPNNANNGAFDILTELGAGPVTETFTINSTTATGLTHAGQIGVALDPEPYEVRATVYSGIGGCDTVSLNSNVLSATPISAVPALDGTIADQVYIEQSAITDLVLPAGTGGNSPLTYSLTPALPQGLSVNLATRTLSGTPTVAQAATTYTWKVEDGDGDTDEEEFTITVLADESPQLPATPPIPDQSYIEGVQITALVLPAATGGNAPLTYSLTPTPPQGLSVNLATRTLTGTPTVTQAATTYTWRVTDTDGDTAEQEFTITVLADESPQLPAVDDVTYIAGSAITPLVLPEGTGGNAPLTHLLVGTPPAGLTFDTPTRTLSGTPSAAQAATTYTWRVTDTDGDTAEREFTITVLADQSPQLAAVNDVTYIAGSAITPLVLPEGTGGNAPLTHALVGTPPAGLTFDTPTRTLSGTPSAAQAATTYTWRVTDTDGDTAEREFTITVLADQSPQLAAVNDVTYIAGSAITPLVLPEGTGGNAPLTHLLVGTPPAGLTFDTPTRTLSGTPSAAQAATTYTWRVTDTDGDTAEREFTITVLADQSPQLAAVNDVTYIAGSAITPLVLPEGTGGNAPLTHLLVGTPPAGLTFDTPTRTLSGTPSAAQAATTYTWRVTDTDGDTAEREFTITVLADQSPQLAAVNDVTYIAGSAITPLVLPEGTGGNAPLTHLLVGTPPAGLTFDTPTRTLSGTPSAAQAATTYTWRVTDTDGDTAEREFTITVLADQSPQLAAVSDVTYIAGSAITPLVLPEGTGGNAPLTHALVGTPPAGLTFDTPTRTLSGTPSAAQAATTYTWRVTDTDGDTAEREFTITVLADQSPQLAAVNDVTYIAGSAITPLVLPEGTGGNAPLTHLLVGTPPAGLTFDTPTRTLSGTPTAAQAATTYTWRVTDTDGDTAEREFTITVLADQSPQLAAVNDVTYIAGSAITPLVLPEGTGGNAPLTHALVGTPPAGLTFDTPTRTLSGTPSAAQAATTYTWRVTDTDGDTAEREFTITVLADQSPQLAAVSDVTYIAGSAITPLVLPEGTGGNAPLTHALVGTPPAGLTFDTPTRTLSGTPSAAQAATTYTWRVTDTDGDTAEREFTITVLADQSPQLAAVSDVTYIAGSAITPLVLPEGTGGNAPLTHALVGTPPAGLTFDTPTRTLSGTPSAAQAATTYTWRVTDTDGDTAEREFTITVLADQSPQLAAVNDVTYIAGSAITPLVLPEGTGGNAPLTHALVGTPPAGLTFDTPTRTLSGTPSAAQAATTYTWRVTDTDGDTAEREFTITVLADQSPQLAAVNDVTYIAGSAITPLVLPEGTGGNAPLTHALVGTPPAGLTFDTPTRTLSGTPTAAQAATTYTWRVTDTDGDTAEREFTITVLADQSPQLAAVSDVTYIAGSAITPLVLPEGTGGNAPLTHALVGTPPAGLTFDTPTRTLSGTPTAAQAATTYTWRVTDTDGDTAEREFTITVLADQSPQLAAVNDVTYIAGSAITPLVLPEGTGGNAPLTHLLVGTPPAGLTFDTPTRTLSGTPTAAQAATTYTWRVTDTDGDTAEREFTITVLADQSPQLAAVSDVTYIAGSAITPLVLPEGTGGNAPLTHALVGTPPAGLTFDTPTRTLSGTPSAAQAATTYTWRVTDTDGDTAEREFTITVLADQSPQLAAVNDVTYIAGSAITPLVLPEGTGGNAPLTHLLVGTPPAGLTFDTPTRTLSGTPTAAQAATTYTWRVTDTDGDTAEREFTITVLADQSPQLAAVSDVTYIAGSAITPLVLPEGTGGNAPLTHALVGTPPAGLTFDTPTRTLSGTPTAAQAATTYTWRVTDTDGDTAEREFTITVLADQSPQLAAVNDVTYIAGSAITPLVLPEGTGGNAPLTHALVGTPPAGLTFDTPTRTLSGTPSAAQAATTYTWRVTDTDGDTAEQEFTITVLGDQSPQLTAVNDVTYIAGSAITPLVLPEGTGGNAPLTHLLVGTPPAGLTFDTPTRTLSGTPTAAQAATTYTWRVTDTDGDTAEREFTITVLADQSPQLAAVERRDVHRGVGDHAAGAAGGDGRERAADAPPGGDAAGGTDVRHADADAVGDADGGAGGDDVHVAGDGHGRGHGGAGVHDHGAGGPEPAAGGGQ